MKKGFAREFLWLMVALVLAIPLGLVFLWLIGFTSETTVVTDDDRSMLINLYLIGYLLSVIGVYIARFIVVSTRILVAK
jgi:hypothetical protein